MLIKDKLIAEGGWIERPGCTVFNLIDPQQSNQKPDRSTYGAITSSISTVMTLSTSSFGSLIVFSIQTSRSITRWYSAVFKVSAKTRSSTR